MHVQLPHDLCNIIAGQALKIVYIQCNATQCVSSSFRYYICYDIYEQSQILINTMKVCATPHYTHNFMCT